VAQMDRVQKWILPLSIMLIAGCSTSTRVPPVEEYSSSTPVVSVAGSPVQRAVAATPISMDRAPSLSDPLQEMLGQIEQALRQGELSRAEILLERALRIDAQRASLWHDLARIRYQQKSYKESVTLAQRSNRWASGKPVLQKENWTLIAQSKEALGDSAGARQAWINVGGN